MGVIEDDGKARIREWVERERESHRIGQINAKIREELQAREEA
jgi:hypothetical protein